MQNILFVCLGNICRSCTAEEIFKSIIQKAGCKKDFLVDSAGLIDYHEGELPDPRMCGAALRHGYKLTHRSRPISLNDFEKFDLIAAMDESNYQRLARLSDQKRHVSKIVMMADYLRQQPPSVKTIPDPYYGTEEDFERTVLLLEDACNGLFESLMQ